MEYFFDIATPEEIEKQYLEASNSPKLMEFTRQHLKEHPDSNLTKLVYLYWGRGEKEKAEQLRQQIKSESRRLSVAITLYELREG